MVVLPFIPIQLGCRLYLGACVYLLTEQRASTLVKQPLTLASRLPTPAFPSLTYEPARAVLPNPRLTPGDILPTATATDGITDYLITDLSRSPDLLVIARNSTFTYKGKAVTVQQVGRELGVRTVLEGSVFKAPLGYL